MIKNSGNIGSLGSYKTARGKPLKFYGRILERFGPNAAHLAEFMIGLDPKARIYLDDPTYMEAHRHAGCLHCAIGQSVDGKRSVSPGIHLDI